MKYEILKISKIVEEMMDLFFSNSAKKINMSVEENENSYIIIVESDYVKCSEEKVMKIRGLLDVQRQREIEEYYWQLAGNDLDGEEYNLVGMMVDESEIIYNEPTLKIRLTRNK